ncbi:TPA: hypothetical protein ACMDRV_002492 [Vibrio parahaemolyticus]|uniref:hypothetical protein n=1 Tax=Vibrio parahaemolyticus TaxID=670 RepID=UPI0013022918|nr:hypothetical protein [Vibrio parahaemolyticus]
MMRIIANQLNKNHPVVLAARLMSEAYHRHETMIPACSLVKERFPELEPEQIMCLWIGVNAANQNNQ